MPNDAKTDVKTDTKTDPEVVVVKAAPPPVAPSAADALMADLLALNERAVEQGHSIVELLIANARAAFGIDIRPLPPVVEDPTA